MRLELINLNMLLFMYLREKEIDYSESDLDWNEDDNIEDSKIIADYTKKKLMRYMILKYLSDTLQVKLMIGN